MVKQEAQAGEKAQGESAVDVVLMEILNLPLRILSCYLFCSAPGLVGRSVQPVSEQKQLGGTDGVVLLQ